MRVWKFFLSFVVILVSFTTFTYAYDSDDYFDRDVAEKIINGKFNVDIEGLKPNTYYRVPLYSSFVVQYWTTSNTKVYKDGKLVHQLGIGSNSRISWTINEDIDEVGFYSSADGKLHVVFAAMDKSGKNVIAGKLPDKPKPPEKPIPEKPIPKIGEGFKGTGPFEFLLYCFVQVFDQLKIYGIKIVVSAITLGVVFIGGRWLWSKLKIWLSRI